MKLHLIAIAKKYSWEDRYTQNNPNIFTKIKDFFVKYKEMRDFEKSKLEIKKLEDEWRKDWEKIGRVFNFDPIKEEKKALQSISKLIEKDLKNN